MNSKTETRNTAQTWVVPANVGPPGVSYKNNIKMNPKSVIFIISRILRMAGRGTLYAGCQSIKGNEPLLALLAWISSATLEICDKLHSYVCLICLTFCVTVHWSLNLRSQIPNVFKLLICQRESVCGFWIKHSYWRITRTAFISETTGVTAKITFQK